MGRTFGRLLRLRVGLVARDDAVRHLPAAGLPLLSSCLGPFPLPLPAPAGLAAEPMIGGAGLEELATAPVGAAGEAVRVHLVVLHEIVGPVIDPTSQPADRVATTEGRVPASMRSRPPPSFGPPVRSSSDRSSDGHSDCRSNEQSGSDLEGGRGTPGPVGGFPMT